MTSFEHQCQDTFDLAVIGGGCVGTAVAMFAARAGVKTALVERDDFGSGTTGASTELIHGGLQYLFRLRFAIVRQSNEYARRIYRSASHLCRPVPIIVPCYRGGPVPWRALRVFMAMYERYNRRYKQAPPAEKLTAEQIADQLPGIDHQGLLGGVKYYEWWIDAPRLCLTNALWAAEHGATVRNHANVIGIERGGDGLFRVTLDDKRLDRRVKLKCRTLVNATGPWTDRLCQLAGSTAPPRIRPTRGAHLLVPKVADVGLLLHFVDGRFGIILPRGHLSLIGTTDDDYYGDLDELAISEDEVGYLFQGTQRFLPALRREDIVDTKVGVRPTIFQYGKKEDKLSRDHRVEQNGDRAPGMISVYGGKLATHTLMAEDVLAAVGDAQGKSLTCAADYRLPGAPEQDVESYLQDIIATTKADDLAGIDQATREALVRRYGTRHEQVLELVEQRPELAENLCRCQREGQPAQRILAAEIVLAAREEWAVTREDIMRRTGLGLGTCRRHGCLDRAEPWLAEVSCPTTDSHAGPGGAASPSGSASTTDRR